MVASTGSAGECYDHAMAESFLATLECDLIDRRSLRTRARAHMATIEHLESWYDTGRLHCAPGYLSPNEFECCAAARCSGASIGHREQTNLGASLDLRRRRWDDGG